MDFDKTSFSVDLYTPGDKYAPKRLSFPKSARISIDDLDSPLSFCFSPVDSLIPRSYSFVDSPFEPARGWTNTALDRDILYDQDLKKSSEEERSEDWRKLASPGLLSIANDCALCGVDLDLTCLDALDEQLLLTPIACFSDVCWADAVSDEVQQPVSPPGSQPVKSNHSRIRGRSRSFKCEYDRAFKTPLEREYPGSFERSRPLAARITLPLDVSPHQRLRARACEPHATSLMFEKTLPYIPKSEPMLLPVQGIAIPRRVAKRDHALTPRSIPSTPPKSGHTLRVISDAFTRRRKSPQ